VLSDSARRKQYDILYASQSYERRTDDPRSSSAFFSTFSNMFSAAPTTGTSRTEGRPDADNQFADVFEEVSLTTLLDLSVASNLLLSS
jgi:hypothetical protein